jgi:hypothetical protein
MVQSTYDIIKDFGVPIATLVVGFVSGIKTTIYADRRREFNEIVNDLYFRMKSQIEANIGAVEDIDIDRIEHYIPWYQRRRFRNRAERYKQSQNGVSEYNFGTGSVTVDEVAKAQMLKCAANVLHYLKPR